MLIWLLLFYTSIFVVLYNYLGYAVIVVLLNAVKKRLFPQPAAVNAPLPTVSFIVAAYNEADCIEQKIQNSLALDYPSGKIEFLFITDGSTDATPGIVARYPQVKLLHKPERQGKSAALNRVAAAAGNDILVFNDANTILNPGALLQLVQHYADARVGGVAGEKKVLSAADSNEVGEGEGMYWKYESFLKKIDARFYSVVGAAGELFSMRRSLFTAVPQNIILDDFVISLQAAQKGYRIMYEPAAVAMELPSFSLEDEQKRKVRIAAGGFQAMWLLRSLLFFWKHPRLTFLYVSHRVLRWALSPFCLIITLLSNIALACITDGYLYKITLMLQCCFYAAAFLSRYAKPGTRLAKLLKLPYYFVFMNLSVVLGFIRFVRGGQAAAWEKSRRASIALSAE
ncbi:glycosyltransferase family 2 protein [Deminuibacter soli]|uniref:Glycosyltransferase family 2 protein n=1 Tax=Deminuibacter soli TaxID=2291815 RepID=A0A3E1NQU4_9BACT|nr:glycosyltransferase family 2 protein [Deminuibacter soli]RFM30184.1 glycosyltransferase family 2 protein [Deminuibacter soli]